MRESHDESQLWHIALVMGQLCHTGCMRQAGVSPISLQTTTTEPFAEQHGVHLPAQAMWRRSPRAPRAACPT